MPVETMETSANTNPRTKKYNKDLEFEDGYAFIPSLIKIYWSKSEFNKVINSICMQDNMSLNKDYDFRSEHAEVCDFKEYISEKGKTKVLIEELNNSLNLRITVGNHLITGWFNKKGDGYFKFCSRVQKTEEAVLILECAETHEIIHIKFSVRNIEISKKPHLDQLL